jgi:transcriptional regulator with XRE-family HTH domain
MGNELGQFLEELRGKLSLRDAAEKSGLSHTYIRDLELGLNRKTKAPIRPSADTLIQLAKAYNCPPNDLLKVAGYIEEDVDSNNSVNYDSLSEINKLVEKYGLDQLGFFDIEQWKNLSPDDVLLLEEQFKSIVKFAKKRNENNKD